MEQLVIHPQTRRQLDSYLQTPPQAIVLVGPAGSGKSAMAQQLAETALGLRPGGFAAYSYGTTVTPEDGKAIGIEAARQLEHFLSLKVPGKQGVNRAVIIEDSHLLTVEAQNALLKTLEEPPAGTLVILTASHQQALLPTINSRLQTVAVRRPTQRDLQAYFQTQGFDKSDISRTYAMSGGLPALMQALLSDDDHPLRAAAVQARQLLGQSTFERLVTVDILSKQRELAVDTLNILQQMAHISLQTASGSAAERWQKVLRASYDTAEAIQASAQLKLALTNLALRF
jgi:hypothetical protein